VTYLATRVDDYEKLVLSVELIWWYFCKYTNYPIIVFVRNSFEDQIEVGKGGKESTTEQEKQVATDHMIGTLRDKLGPHGAILYFERISFELPLVLQADPTWVERRNECATKYIRGNLDYMHMNQFFTWRMYQHPRLADFDYYMRVDTDAFLHEKVCEDPFVYMRERDIQFMYPKRKRIATESCSEGLWEATEEYRKQKGIIPVNNASNSKFGWNADLSLTIFHGFIGLGNLNFFRSKQYMEYAQFLNEDGRIYVNRWSDQTIYVLATAMFLPEKQTQAMPSTLQFAHHAKPAYIEQLQNFVESVL